MTWKRSFQWLEKEQESRVQATRAKLNARDINDVISTIGPSSISLINSTCMNINFEDLHVQVKDWDI